MLDAFLGGLGTIGSGIAGFFGQRSANKSQRKAAREQMKFQERMSSTAYQRAMSDMRAAGLNPILAGKVGGASSPAGAQPNIRNELESASASAKSLAADVQNVRLQSANLRNIEATNAKIHSENKILQEKYKQEITNTAKARATEPLYSAAGDITTAAKDAWSSAKDYLSEKLPDLSTSDFLQPSSAKARVWQPVVGPTKTTPKRKNKWSNEHQRHKARIMLRHKLKKGYQQRKIR